MNPNINEYISYTTNYLITYFQQCEHFFVFGLFQKPLGVVVLSSDRLQAIHIKIKLVDD